MVVASLRHRVDHLLAVVVEVEHDHLEHVAGAIWSEHERSHGCVFVAQVSDRQRVSDRVRHVVCVDAVLARRSMELFTPQSYCRTPRVAPTGSAARRTAQAPSAPPGRGAARVVKSAAEPPDRVATSTTAPPSFRALTRAHSVVGAGARPGAPWCGIERRYRAPARWAYLEPMSGSVPPSRVWPP